jgi:hypothetical protein
LGYKTDFMIEDEAAQAPNPLIKDPAERAETRCD